MITVINMAMVGLPAIIIIEKMARHDKENCGNQQPVFIMYENLLDDEKDKTNRKNKYG